MKHIHTFAQHLNESQSYPNEITREFFYDLVRGEGQPTWESLSNDEMQKILSLYDYINERGIGSISPNQSFHKDKCVRFILDDLREGYPRLKIGKKSPEAWTLNIQEDNNNSLHLDSRFYLFRDLASLMGFVASKFGNRVEWIKIR